MLRPAMPASTDPRFRWRRRCARRRGGAPDRSPFGLSPNLRNGYEFRRGLAEGLRAQALAREDARAVREGQARQGADLRHPAPRRAPAPLRLPARARRRSPQLGGPQGRPAGARHAAPRRPRRGPPAHVRDVRGRDPGGQLRRRHGRDLGPGHVRARRGEAERRHDGAPARRAAGRAVDARPGEARRRPEELAAREEEGGGRSRGSQAGAPTSRCWPRSPTLCRRARSGCTR